MATERRRKCSWMLMNVWLAAVFWRHAVGMGNKQVSCHPSKILPHWETELRPFHWPHRMGLWHCFPWRIYTHSLSEWVSNCGVLGSHGERQVGTCKTSGSWVFPLRESDSVVCCPKSCIHLILIYGFWGPQKSRHYCLRETFTFIMGNWFLN